MPLTVPRPEVTDADGANLDPRNCDCGKGSCCPLVTREWMLYLADQGIDLDSWGGSWSNVPTFAAVDLRGGAVFAHDEEGRPFTLRSQAEAFARSRNEGLLVAAQTYRVVALEPLLYAEVKPRPLGD